MFKSETQKTIVAHMIADYPREACGLVVETSEGERYVPCENLATHDEDFKLSARDWASAEDLGEIKAIVHSHPDDSAEPSDSDKLACEEHGIPWVIYSIRDKQLAGVKVVNPTGWKAPLVGRAFHHGTLDCYTLIQDWYLRECGIKLPDFEREDNWWQKGEDLYLKNFEAAGFVKLPQDTLPKEGDVLLMQIRSKVPNHGAVFIGDRQLKEAPNLHKVYDAILHHLYGRLSTREPYGGYWRHVTTHVLRYKDELPAQ